MVLIRWYTVANPDTYNSIGLLHSEHVDNENSHIEKLVVPAGAVTMTIENVDEDYY